MTILLILFFTFTGAAIALIIVTLDRRAKRGEVEEDRVIVAQLVKRLMEEK